LTKTYPATAGSPAAARAMVLERLQALGCADVAEVVCLLTSELVTNAVIHAATSLTIRLRVEPDLVRVEVEDGGAWSDQVELQAVGSPADSPDALAPAGRGLQIVESLSAHWGVMPARRGTTVWFELPLSPVPNGAAAGHLRP
jgi:anti-sigma regulatory factor (Ser/Thr protein kinase)